MKKKNILNCFEPNYMTLNKIWHRPRNQKIIGQQIHYCMYKFCSFWDENGNEILKIQFLPVWGIF